MASGRTRGPGMTIHTLGEELKQRKHSRFADKTPTERSRIVNDDVAEFLRNKGSITVLDASDTAYTDGGVLKKLKPEYQRRAKRARNRLEELGHPNAGKGRRKKPATRY